MMRRAFLLCLLLLLSFISVHAQKRAFTIEDLYRVKNVSDLHVSPDGKNVIFVVTTSDLARAKRNSHLWGMDVSGQNLRQLLGLRPFHNSVPRVAAKRVNPGLLS